MNPMISDAVLAVLRHVLTVIGGWLVSQGLLAEGQLTTLVAGGATVLLAIGLSLWQKFTSRRKLVTALASPVGTEQRVEATIAAGHAAAVMTIKTDVPI